MVGLHMVNHEIVGLPAAEHLFDLVQPLFAEMRVGRVEYGNLFVENDVGVVRYAVGHFVHTLKKVDRMVVDAYAIDVVFYFEHKIYTFIL